MNEDSIQSYLVELGNIIVSRSKANDDCIVKIADQNKALRLVEDSISVFIRL